MAADAVGGLFIPAGQTWAEAFDLDSSLLLYSADGFHPSGLGSLAVGMTVYAVLFDVPADSIPELDVNVSPDRWETLRQAVALSLATAADSIAPLRSP